jgi:hypothetical protein
MAKPATIQSLRRAYHRDLCGKLLSLRGSGEDGVLNIADGHHAPSVDLANRMLGHMAFPASGGDHSGQSLGKLFAEYTRDFLSSAFGALQHLRPGSWIFSTNIGQEGIARYAQYAHLAQLAALLRERPDLKASLGGDYLVTPDIVLYRSPVTDAELNQQGQFVEPSGVEARRTPLRANNLPDSPPILSASISMKWTMRSDRSQNTRTEALNLLRNRKGNTPQIVVVTFEPLPTRLASIAMGTGDVDCTYHAALDELLAGAQESTRTDQLETLQMLIDGRRLRDISDLPLDLAT